jgi:hypothetical protein
MAKKIENHTDLQVHQARGGSAALSDLRRDHSHVGRYDQSSRNMDHPKEMTIRQSNALTR